MDSHYRKQLNRRYFTGLLMTFGLITILAILMFSSGLIAAEISNTKKTNSEQLTDVKTKTIFLVRHAEKESGNDPFLTAEGKIRAQNLSNLLQSVPLDAIYSTDYNRTQDTAKPTASVQSLTITSYNPRKLSDFATAIKANHHQRILIVGHSNTTPELVSLLGGIAEDEIVEATEFNRLYILTIDHQEQQTSSVLLRY
ncbi:histidine phosphatase family protein [Shewanella electrodiphila]|uniref:Histidine phosphatase family protein n=1 Tax=Shewanella electrodiphila TaxID=934143 RepID=A0ABT0KQ79_9GAMM|nr:phosphoglycerate mutase family protein [Shewanella electrodiphila]MCL1045893.1 histidine phosphatase family protein [Shewanella electrodiphila]